MSKKYEQKFIEECKDRFGITIDCDKMNINSAKKTLSKVYCIFYLKYFNMKILALPEQSLGEVRFFPIITVVLSSYLFVFDIFLILGLHYVIS